MNRLIALTLLAIGATGVTGGATSNQPIDPFLASGHELVHRLCQGGLGCGPFKTKWEPKREKVPIRASSTDLAHFYGDDIDNEERVSTEQPVTDKTTTDRPESTPTQTFPHSNFPITSTVSTLSSETDTTTLSISFVSNTSIDGLKRAVELMCLGRVNCSASENREHDEEYVEDSELENKNSNHQTLILAITVGLIATVSLAIIACAVFFCYKCSAKSGNEENAEIQDKEFECVDLENSSTHSPLPSPPPTPPQADENYIFDYGSGRYLQVTEL